MSAGDARGDSMAGEAANMDRFPVGMRVLAVDDDPVCLKLLECLLLRCRYHVTTTNQAITALTLLRENKDKFDLVISDVHMPDMDGFKLLELVGLEMDLPVIMMSVNGETKTVMKGITHGACDYLLKPVRIEELRNIWQHVVRRRKFDRRIYSSFEHREDTEKLQNANCESGKCPNVKGPSDHSEKSNKKRKDMNDDDEEDSDENPQENEDPSSQKKPRVVWSIDLHRKFVAAVNQLGIDKAVPKRILELMNVDKLTRENVASHLQKYRLYLKRLSAVAIQQANLVAAFGGRDTSCLHMGSSDEYGNFQALATSGQLLLASCQPSGMLSRPSTTGLGFYSHAPAAIDRVHTLNNMSIPLVNKLQQIDGPGSQQGSFLHGIPTSLELEQLQPKIIQDASIHLPADFPHSGQPTGSSSFLGVNNSSLLSHAPKQERNSKDLFVHSSMRIPSTSSDPCHISTRSSSHFPDFDKSNNTWQAAAPLAEYITNDLSVVASTCEELSKIPIHASKRQRDDNSISNASSDAIVTPPQLDHFEGSDTKCQVNSFSVTRANMPVTTDGETKLMNFGSGHESKQKLEEPKQNHAHQYELEYSSVANLSSSHNFLRDSDHGNKMMDFSYHKNISIGNMISNVNLNSSVLIQMPKTNNLMVDPGFKYKDEDIVEITESKSELLSNGCILDDLVGSIVKLERDDITFMDNDISYNFYPLGACM